MRLSELIEACGEDVSFQMLSQCLHGNQKTIKQGTQVCFVTDVPLIDLISKKPGQIGLVVWLPGDKFREIQNNLHPDPV